MTNMALKSVFRALPALSRLLPKRLGYIYHNIRALSSSSPICNQVLKQNPIERTPNFTFGTLVLNQSEGLLKRVLSAGFTGQSATQVRHYKGTYRINVHKRLKKHGMKKMLSTRRGKVVLWRRVLKGRHSLAVDSA